MFKKKKRSKSKTRVVYKKAKRRSKSRGSSGAGSVTTKIIGGFTYGALRGHTSNLARPITDKLGFLGEYADNVVMAGLSYALAKRKIPVLKNIKLMSDVGKAGLVVESTMAGSDFSKQMLSSKIPIVNGSSSEFR